VLRRAPSSTWLASKDSSLKFLCCFLTGGCGFDTTFLRRRRRHCSSSRYAFLVVFSIYRRPCGGASFRQPYSYSSDGRQSDGRRCDFEWQCGVCGGGGQARVAAGGYVACQYANVWSEWTWRISYRLDNVLTTLQRDCLTGAIAASPCDLTDLTCSCSNATITEQVAICITGACTVKQSLSKTFLGLPTDGGISTY
jgi:hypothetical protein